MNHQGHYLETWCTWRDQLSKGQGDKVLFFKQQHAAAET